MPKPWRATGSCDRPTCPTALLLVLDITASHVAIPHIYRLHSVSLTCFVSITKPPIPVPSSIFPLSPSLLIPVHDLCISFTFPDPSKPSSLFTFCLQKTFRSPEVFLPAGPSLPVANHKPNTERKRVCQFGWWCACTCMAAPPVASGHLLFPLPRPSDVSERSFMSSPHVYLRVLLPPSSCYL